MNLNMSTCKRNSCLWTKVCTTICEKFTVTNKVSSILCSINRNHATNIRSKTQQLFAKYLRRLVQSKCATSQTTQPYLDLRFMTEKVHLFLRMKSLGLTHTASAWKQCCKKENVLWASSHTQKKAPSLALFLSVCHWQRIWTNSSENIVDQVKLVLDAWSTKVPLRHLITLLLH